VIRRGSPPRRHSRRHSPLLPELGRLWQWPVRMWRHACEDRVAAPQRERGFGAPCEEARLPVLPAGHIRELDEIERAREAEDVAMSPVVTIRVHHGERGRVLPRRSLRSPSRTKQAGSSARRARRRAAERAGRGGGRADRARGIDTGTAAGSFRAPPSQERTWGTLSLAHAHFALASLMVMERVGSSQPESTGFPVSTPSGSSAPGWPSPSRSTKAK
jgi:hypothetical protein